VVGAEVTEGPSHYSRQDINSNSKKRNVRSFFLLFIRNKATIEACGLVVIICKVKLYLSQTKHLID